MGFIDRMLSGVGLQRMGMSGEGSLRGARRGRLSNTFEQERKHINAAILSGGATLRARSRYHCREGGLLEAAKSTWVAYAVGSGIAPTWPDVTPEVRRVLHKAFHKWAKRCDHDGLTTYYGLQAIIAGEMFEAGEVFIRFIRSPGRPVQLQLIRSEQLPYDVIYAVGGDTDVRLGIEFAKNTNRRIAYHFYRQDPGDSTKATSADIIERVPAEEILHVYRVEQPGQLRGIPQTKSALIPSIKLDSYDDNMLDRAEVASAFAVFIKRDQNDRESGAANGQNPETGEPEAHIEGGSIIEGGPGEEPFVIDPPDAGTNYDAFTFRQATRCTAAMGVPYAETTGDLRKANYSSTRAGRQPFKRRIEQHQQFWMVPQFCDPVVLAWLADALLRDSIALPESEPRVLDAYDNIDHVPPYWEYVDPRGDAQADVLLVDNLIKARSRVAAERGEDPVELDETIAVDQAREKRLKLVRGSTSTARKEPEEDEDEDRDDPDDKPDDEEKDDQ